MKVLAAFSVRLTFFSSPVGHGLKPTRHWRTVGIDAIRGFSEMSPPSLRDVAIRHRCVATSAAHRARLVLTSTPVFDRNAQIAVVARGPENRSTLLSRAIPGGLSIARNAARPRATVAAPAIAWLYFWARPNPDLGEAGQAPPRKQNGAKTWGKQWRAGSFRGLVSRPSRTLRPA